MSVYSLKGFVKIKSMINNNPGFISGLGELSTYSQTFSQDIKEYESTIGSLSNYRLHAFYSVDKNSADVTAPAVYVESVFQCTKIVHDFCASFVGQITKLDIANNLNSMLFGKIDNIVVGDLVTSNGLTMPSSLAWSVIGAEANTLKVWYADQNFSVEYPEYKTLVVPPIDNLDDFFKPVTEIKAALAARSFTRTAELIDEKKNKHPETILRMNEFTLTLANNPEYAPSTVWSTITYGAAGDNLDNIKQAIRDYCLANSSYGMTEWARIFPDIFKTTEFYLIPRWDLVAIPNKTTEKGANSPFTNPTDILTSVKAMYPTIAAQHIEQNVLVGVHPFMSVAFACFGGTENKASKYKITDYFPDYIAVGTNSMDFNRMSKKTQDWSYMINNLLRIAEDETARNNLPINTRMITRAGVTYASQTMDGILYLVATKENFY